MIREDTVPTGEALAPLLAVHNLSVGRASGGTLAGLTLSLAPGEVVVLRGRGGSGKSRVLRCLLGLEAPKDGDVELLGERVRALDHDGLMRLRARASYASVLLPPLANLTVRANLEVPLRMRGLALADVSARVADIVAELELSPFVERRPHSLPHYALCLAALARALVTPAELYLLDEPMRAFQDGGEALVRSLEVRLARGAAFVVAAADGAALRPLSPRVIDVEQLARADGAH